MMITKLALLTNQPSSSSSYLTLLFDEDEDDDAMSLQRLENKVFKERDSGSHLQAHLIRRGEKDAKK